MRRFRQLAGQEPVDRVAADTAAQIPGLARKLLARGRLLLLFDGLDEVEGLENSTFSTTVSSMDLLPIVVERTMTWANGFRRGGHNSPGVPATAPSAFSGKGCEVASRLREAGST